MKIKIERKEKVRKIKKVPTIKVGTHKKRTIALWFLLLTSITFGVYKNFTAVNQHTVHEKEVIEQRIMDTSKIESFSQNFITVFYSWEHNQKALDHRTEKLKGYLTEDLQSLNADMVRTDVPTNSQVESIQFWNIQSIDKNTFEVLFTVEQSITEQDKKRTVDSAYTLAVYVDEKENMVIVKNPTASSVPIKSNYNPKVVNSEETVDGKTKEEIDSFILTFFTIYPKANDKELSYYVSNQALKPIEKEYRFLELVSSNYSKKGDKVLARVLVKYLDPLTKTSQVFDFNLVLQKDENWIIIK